MVPHFEYPDKYLDLSIYPAHFPSRWLGSLDCLESFLTGRTVRESAEEPYLDTSYSNLVYNKENISDE